MTPANHFFTAGNSFVTFDHCGDITDRESHGLFVADTRHLSYYRIRFENLELNTLRSGRSGDDSYEFFSTNQADVDIPAQSIVIHRRRWLADLLVDQITLQNVGDSSVTLTLLVEFEADFADIFEIRGLAQGSGERSESTLDSGAWTLAATRRASERKTAISFAPHPSRIDPGRVEFTVHLEPNQSQIINIEIRWTSPPAPSDRPSPVSRHGVRRSYLDQTPSIETNDPILERAFRQAIQDLRDLEIPLDSGESIPAAGLPWYRAIFGRDSLIASMQTMMLGPRIALGTLRTLAAYQSTEMSAFHDAEPGKMPHEIRFGELANTGEIPHARYYGTADATALWIMLLRDVALWSGDLDTILELLPNAERTLEWIEEYGDLDGDGFIEYQRRSERGLANQGWKDSNDSIRFKDGSIAEGPIALVEVQGYAFAARIAMSEIYDLLGENEKARSLRSSAETLRQAIDEAFWMPEDGFYALALDGEKRPVDSITSNAGHLLWCGVPHPDRAAMVADRLMAPDMFSGWGIRTMSSTMAGYNPVSYHNGSVWPHDNSLILAGFARYGFQQPAITLANAMLETTAHFPEYRLPELFCGFSRHSTPFPVDYPTSCIPQAWAAGALVLVTQALAGLFPDSDELRNYPPPHRRRLRLRDIAFRGTHRDLVCDDKAR
jgi:glycogen debranching enzyme